MKLTERTCKDFADVLASKEAVPGGGGAAALVGALGVALNSMVANFSIGKKKFKDVEDKHRDILERGYALKDQLIELIDKDAENFLPLSKAYGIKALTDEEKAEKDKVLQDALKVACSAPVQMVECDIGVGVQCLKAALYSAQLNVVINVNSIKDEEYTSQVRENTEEMVEKGSRIADQVYKKVIDIMG